MNEMNAVAFKWPLPAERRGIQILKKSLPSGGMRGGDWFFGRKLTFDHPFDQCVKLSALDKSVGFAV